MCKHVLNAQVSIRAPCCRNWYDCPECHAEVASHDLFKTLELIMACKKCKKVFKKDLNDREGLEEAGEYCPYCDNHFVLEAVEPSLMPTLPPSLPAMSATEMEIIDNRIQSKERG